MNELAFISNGAKKYITSVNDAEYEIMHSDDILTDVNKFISEFPHNDNSLPPMAVLFVDFAENPYLSL